MIAQSRLLLSLTVALLALPSLAVAQDQDAPNVDLDAFMRIFSTTEKAQLRAWVYNTNKATFAAYRVELAEIAPDAYAINTSEESDERGVPWRVKHLDLSRRSASARWSLTVAALAGVVVHDRRFAVSQ